VTGADLAEVEAAVAGRASSEAPPLLVRGAASLVTLAGGLRRGDGQGDLAVVADGWVAIRDGRVLAVGPREAVEAAIREAGLTGEEFAVLDARGGTVTPGLVDPHTHLLFAGSREDEWELRRRGASYLEILAAGGGILSTVAATRAASDQALLEHGRRWLGEMLRHGTTTAEAKSGYGLSVESELRLLSLLHRLGQEGPVEVIPTFLGAHAVPAEFRAPRAEPEAYVQEVIERQIPAVARQGIARFCDVFCEVGVFTADQSRRILRAAAAAGLGVRLHADELAPSGGAELAAELGAHSADHLGAPSEEGIAALAARAERGRPVVAVLLPATTWFLRKGTHAPARRMIEAGIPVALGTDFNPGTSPTASLPLVMTVACLALGLSAEEALAAVTINAAFALGLEDRLGSLEVGRDGDLVVWDVPRPAQIPYWPGADLVRAVVKGGRVVYQRGW
jgi:imidazolonepropionase